MLSPRCSIAPISQHKSSSVRIFWETWMRDAYKFSLSRSRIDYTSLFLFQKNKAVLSKYLDGMRVTLFASCIIFYHVCQSLLSSLALSPSRPHSLAQKKFLFSLKKCKTQKRAVDRLLQALSIGNSYVLEILLQYST